MLHYIQLLSKIYASLVNFYSAIEMSTTIASRCFFGVSIITF